MHHHGHHGHHGHAHNHAHNIALMHHQHHSDMHHSAHHAAHHRGGHRRAHRFGDDDNVVVYLPPPSGTVLTVTFTTEIPGFPRLNSLPSSMEVESGGGGYAALLESSNRLIQQLNHAVEENYATPMRLRRICLCISILCFLGFGISGFMAVSTFGAPAAVGGVVACFLGFAIFGIFIPVGISKYYSTRYLTSIQDCLDQTNRSLRGFHWVKQKGYVDTATQTAVHGISIHLVKDDPAMYPGRMPSAPPQQVVTAEAVVLSNDDDDHVNQYLPKAQVYDDF